MLPLDCWNIILLACDFRTQIHLVSSTNYFRRNLKIKNLLSIEEKYLNKLTNKILQYSIFDQTEKLYASYNSKITNISFMTSLKELHASGECGIDQNGISGLDLVEFYAGGNSKIINVSFMMVVLISNKVRN
jgi:hypothetical protein